MTELSREQIAERVAALGDWFHDMDLNGVRTAPNHFLHDYPNVKWKAFSHALPADLTGKSVLDIGCNAGFFSLEMKRRGADRVLGIDHDDRYLDQARFAAEVRGADIEFRRMHVYDVAELRERFDLVLFMGVLYHLRHPLLALDLIREHVAGDLLLFQCLLRGAPEIEEVAVDHGFFEQDHFNRPGYPKLHFIEHQYSGDWSNWWAPNAAAAEAMLRSSGFDIMDRPEEEVWLCRAAERRWPAEGLYPVKPRSNGAG